MSVVDQYAGAGYHLFVRGRPIGVAIRVVRAAPPRVHQDADPRPRHHSHVRADNLRERGLKMYRRDAGTARNVNQIGLQM